VKDNRLGHPHGDSAGGTAANPGSRVKPYAVTDPTAYAILVSARRYRRTKWRHTTKAALEHPQNEHEHWRAARVGVVHGVLLAAVVFLLALAWGWLSFSWDALKATTTAWRKQADKAHAVVEGTIAVTAALTALAMMTEGWGLLQAVKVSVAFGLLTFPVVFSFVFRREIRWCSDASEKKALARQDDDGDDPPLLTLGETAIPPGLASARGTRGDDDA
jgi:hypothetical protein